MAGIIEQKSAAEMLYNALSDALEIEKRDHPEHYESALRVGKRLQKSIVAFGQLDNLEPLPTLEEEIGGVYGEKPANTAA
ncbi:hypothetical protein FACS1894120_0470 [Clostridia bacterium]|nr:hypothetical protein FACS1894120_0470 [Clostridia bacterium]